MCVRLPPGQARWSRHRTLFPAARICSVLQINGGSGCHRWVSNLATSVNCLTLPAMSAGTAAPRLRTQQLKSAALVRSPQHHALPWSSTAHAWPPPQVMERKVWPPTTSTGTAESELLPAPKPP